MHVTNSGLCQNRKRRGFTLVELLVVIAIIGILAALLIPAVYFAIGKAKDGRTLVEIASVSSALESYKLKMGEYPPDFSMDGLSSNINLVRRLKQNAITNHLARTFRRRNAQVFQGNNFLPSSFDPAGPTDLLTAVELDALNPRTALAFWLKGFSSDPQRPLTGTGDRTPFFGLDQSRFTDSATGQASGQYIDTARPAQRGRTIARYHPKGGTGQSPYLYYRSVVDTNMPSGTIAENFVTGNVQSTEERDALCGFLDAYGWASRRRAVNDPVARPYFQFDSPYTPIDIGNAGLGSQGYPQKLWPAVSYAKFQIISAGNDGVFGEGGNADSQSGATGNLKTNFFEKADLDNLTNFSEGTIDTARDQ